MTQATMVNANPYTSIDYSKIGRTDTGRAWVEKALHPPGAPRVKLAGMPDNEAYPSTTMEFSNATSIAPPTAVGGATTWNALFLSIPGPEAIVLQWTWSAGSTAPTSDMSLPANRPVTLYNPNYNFSRWAHDVSRWRRLYGSSTFEYNAPALSNQGMVYCAQQRLEIGQSTISAPSDPVGATRQHLSMPSQQIVLTSLPTQPNTLQQMSPAFYKQMAKEGCFTVSGLAQPTNLYQQGADCVLLLGSEVNIAADVGFATIGNRTYVQDGVVRTVCSGLSQNWSSCWTLFVGISNSATIELKTVHGYEMQASLGSAFGPFVSTSAEPDTVAVDAYYSLRHGLADAYPASYNFLGSLMSFIPMAIRKVASWLLPHAAAGAASVASKAAAGVNNWAASTRQPPNLDTVSKAVPNMHDAVVTAMPTGGAGMRPIPPELQRRSRIPVPTKPKVVYVREQSPEARRNSSTYRTQSAPARRSRSRKR